MIYILTKYATHQANTDYDATFLRYMDPASIAPQHYAQDLIAKLQKVADVYDRDTLVDVFIENVDQSIRHSLKTTERQKHKRT